MSIVDNMERVDRIDDEPTGPQSIEKQKYYYTQRRKKLQLNAYVESLRCERLVLVFLSCSSVDAGDDISLSMIVYQRIWAHALSICSMNVKCDKANDAHASNGGKNVQRTILLLLHCIEIKRSF